MTLADVMNAVSNRAASWSQLIKALPFDGGPSATRWVFIRVAEVISLGWLALVFGAVYTFVRFGKVDTVYCGMILALGTGLFGFAQNAQTTKLSLDSKTTPSCDEVKRD